jgi:hypothetical protein
MTHVLNTSLLPLADRASFVRDVLTRTMERVDIQFDDHDRRTFAYGVITEPTFAPRNGNT